MPKPNKYQPKTNTPLLEEARRQQPIQPQPLQPTEQLLVNVIAAGR